jgi:hypothetical protein
MMYKRTETVDRIVARKTLHKDGLESTMTKTFHALEQVGHILFWARDAVKLEIYPDEASIRKLTDEDVSENISDDLLAR